MNTVPSCVTSEGQFALFYVENLTVSALGTRGGEQALLISVAYFAWECLLITQTEAYSVSCEKHMDGKVKKIDT